MSNTTTIIVCAAVGAAASLAVLIAIRRRGLKNKDVSNAIRNSLLGRVKAAVAVRGDAREIILADLGLDENAAGGSAKTEALLAEVEAEMNELFIKAEHLRAHFDDLAARLTTLEKDGDLDASRPADKVGSYVFVGNPGTGKTTVAKVLAKWLRAKGVLVSDVVGEESALNLQGQYLGQTKEKVNQLMASAIGGLVFIDEAYNLGGSGGRRASLYAQEAVDQLTYCMTEDTHKGRTIVVLAGYEREMNEMLASANPGFRSRFKQRIAMPDWDAADVVEYLRRRCTKKGIVLADAAQRVLLGGIDDVRKRILIAADGL